MLVGALVLVHGKTAAAHVGGTDGQDVVVNGYVYHYAASEGARADRAGLTVDDVVVAATSYPMDMNLAFDGDGFGAIGMGVEAEPLFWRYRLFDAAE